MVEPEKTSDGRYVVIDASAGQRLELQRALMLVDSLGERMLPATR